MKKHVDAVKYLKEQKQAIEQQLQVLEQNAAPPGNEQGDEGTTQLPAMSKKEVHDASVEGYFVGRLFTHTVGTPDKAHIRDADWPVTANMMGSWVGFETVTLFTDGKRSVPYAIPSMVKWAGKRRNRAVVTDSSEVLEEYYGDQISAIWFQIRNMPAQDVAQMHGEPGLSVVIRAVLQWRAIEPRAHDWKTIVMDITAALSLLRDRPAGYDLRRSLGDLLAQADSPRAEQAEEKLRARSDACDRRRDALQQRQAGEASTSDTRARKRRRKMLKDEEGEE